MKKHLLSFATLVLLAFLTVAPKSAEAQWVGYFSNGAFCLGPEIGLPLGYATSGGVLIGGHGEVAVTNAGTLGSGRLGIAFGIDYWGLSGDGYTLTILPIRALAQYHFVLSSTRAWDPYLGLGLGYAVVSISGTNSSTTSSSGVYVAADAGTRYWFSPTVALRVELGLGFSSEFLALGVDFELN